jgi:membrane protein YdbS with pleckstrin-like domain
MSCFSGLEMVRRSLTLAALIAAVWMVVWPGPAVLMVSAVDFAQMFAQRPAWYQAATPDQTLSQFRQQKTQGRSRQVSGSEWRELVNSLSTAEQSLFSSQDSPFQGLQPYPSFQYLHIIDNNKWLTIKRQWPHKVRGGAGKYAYPLRLPALALAGAGLLLYIFLPRRKRPTAELYYNPTAAVLLPDVLALLLVPLLTVAPAMITWSFTPGTSIFAMQGGWLVLTSLFWVLSVLPMSLLLVGWHYSCWGLELRNNGLALRTIKESRFIPYSTIQSCQAYQRNRSKRLAQLLRLFSFNPSALGISVLLKGQTEHGIELHLGEDQVRLMNNALKGRDRLILALQHKQVPGSAKLG